ncbi:MAG: UbiA family prenyltransferase [Candidatus Aminicenantes bacterium]|nr:UbiA family prenyltransferase [Candidatus Aminicenantes bacterium]
MNAYLRAMRLERWPRSMAIFSGCAAYAFLHRSSFPPAGYFEPAWMAAVAFLLTWGISTANYIVNEIVDLAFDIHHPSKKLRPLVAGEIRKGPFALIGLVLIAACLGLARVVFEVPFLLSLAGLLLAGIVYNVKPIRTKDIPFLDSISESANNPIRFLIGWYAMAPHAPFPPAAVLLSWWAFGNFLMVAKRLSEFRFLKEKAGDYRTSQKKYTRTKLLSGMILSAVVCLAAFVFFGARTSLPSFFAIAPFLVVFFLLIFRKTLREAEVMEEPEKLLASPKFAIYTLFLLALFVASFFLDAAGR